jgi:hypothetical protein
MKDCNGRCNLVIIIRKAIDYIRVDWDPSEAVELPVDWDNSEPAGLVVAWDHSEPPMRSEAAPF